MDSFEGNLVSELYVDEEFCPRVMDRLYEMQRSRTLCDMNLGLDHNAAVHSLSIHRCVLAANSPAFCTLLGEASAPEVTLIVGNSVVVESLIEYMYSGRLRVSLSVARDLLRLGRDYTIGNVACLVEQHLSKSLNISTWFEIFRIAGEFQLTSIEQKTSEFVGANIDKIFEGDEVEHLNYDVLRRILTASQSTDGLKWKVHVILRWCARDINERVCRVAELLDLVNFTALDTFSLQVRLMEESAKGNHSAFDVAIQDCLSRAENSVVNLNCIKLGTNEEFESGTTAKDIQAVSKIDENVVEQLVKVNDEKKLDHGRQTSGDGSKGFLKCYHHSLKRKSHCNQRIEVKSSLESRNTEAVNISLSEEADDPEEISVESSTVELSESETDERENPITTKSEILYFRNVFTGAEGLLTAMPSRASNKKQQLSSSNVAALSVSQCSNSTTVCGDGRKKLTRVRRKRAKTADEMYVCPLCPKQFPTSSAQRQHTKGHGSEIPLLCEVCGFSTRHLASMNVHKQCHFGKRLKCRYGDCSFSAIRSTDLEDHHNAHNGIKSHVCVVCGKAFSHRKHHARHEKIHTDPKKFSCSKCNYYSGRSDKMRDHDRKHHQPKNGADNFITIQMEGGSLKRRKRTKE